MSVRNIQFTKLEIIIVRYLFKHYKDAVNPRQLARILKINHAHANKLCHQLREKMLLKKEEIGNAVFFSFNYEEKKAIKFMEYLLGLEEKEFPKSLVIVAHNLKKFADCIQMGLVFGSSIKESRFNDVDVLLMYEKRRTRDVNRIKQEIRSAQLLEQPIRYVDITEQDAAKNKDDKIFYNMLAESLIFHNAEKYVEVVKKCHR